MRHCVLAWSCLISSALAQRTWIVDAANGAGTDFTDLPAAEAAAVPGDTLLVRSGTYSPFTTSKGLTVIGVRGQTVIRWTNAFEILRVANLPSGQTFAAYGLVLENQGLNIGALSLSGNAGHVHIEGLECRGASYPVPSGGLWILRCASVTVVDCGQQSDVHLNCSSANVAIAGCRLRGTKAVLDTRVGSRAAGPGLTVDGGRVDVADSSMTGGDGATSFSFPPYDSAPGLSLVGLSPTVLRVRGGAGPAIRAGLGTTLPISAISGAGQMELDARVQLQSYGGAPLIDPNVQAVVRTLPGLRAAGGVLGANLTLTHFGEATQPCILAVGSLGTITALPFGDLWLDLAAAVILPPIFADGAGIASLTLPLPANPSLSGRVLPWQAGSSVGSGLALSNAVAVLLR